MCQLEWALTIGKEKSNKLIYWYDHQRGSCLPPGVFHLWPDEHHTKMPHVGLPRRWTLHTHVPSTTNCIVDHYTYVLDELFSLEPKSWCGQEQYLTKILFPKGSLCCTRTLSKTIQQRWISNIKRPCLVHHFQREIFLSIYCREHYWLFGNERRIANDVKHDRSVYQLRSSRWQFTSVKWSHSLVQQHAVAMQLDNAAQKLI